MQFYPLHVENLYKTTDDCTIVTFNLTNDLRERFQYYQGQYLNLKTQINGEELRRSYSLCSSPLDNEWKIGVKKVPDGVFSTYVNDQLSIGDTIEVAPPAGQFFVNLDAQRKRHIIAFAAGSGITPIISMIKTHLLEEPNTSIQLFYVNKTVSSIILKEELEALKNLYLERFEIFYIMTQQRRNVELLSGRLDEHKLSELYEGICKSKCIDDVFICGPQEMMLSIRDFFTSKGVDKKHIHFELFGTKQPLRSVPVDKKYNGKTSDVTVIEGGKTMNFQVSQGKTKILDAALENASDLPFACKGGVCCTCTAMLREGTVDMAVNYALEEDQVRDGYILTCQAIPTSDKVVVDFDV